MVTNCNGLPLDVENIETQVMIEAAISWIRENTTVEFDPAEELPANVKLFVVKYCDLMSASVGVASESLGGMSQSFSTSRGAGLVLSELATQLFGTSYKGRNRFVSAVSRWK